MAKTIDLGARLKAAFGFVAGSQSVSLEDQKFLERSGLDTAGVYVSDASFEEITIKRNSESKLFFGSMLGTSTANQTVFAPPPMVTYDKGKNIIVTPIDGTDAEIVERYGDQSWVIKIQGVLVDMQNHRYPKKQLIQLREFFDVPAPFEVYGEIFDDLGIKSIYFTNISISGVAGYEDTIQYTLDANSIKPVEFFFAKKNN